MKKSKRMFLTGTTQLMFFENFIKESADNLGVRGFIRKLQDGRLEIFVEGDKDKVEQMTEICRRGHQHTQIKKVEEQEERFQDFKDFRIIKF